MRSRYTSEFSRPVTPSVTRSSTLLTLLGILTTALPVLADSADSAGARLYSTHCASCHGKQGEGVKGEYSRELVGDKSIPQLTRYIDRWMPEDDPEKVTGDEARTVARYIHDSFYSPLAQARHRPARIDLSRLTVNQYRNSVLDLIQHFRPDPPSPGKPGLEARYYNDRRPGRKPDLARDEAVVKLHVNPDQPAPEPLDARGFSARWQGSVLAPETGVFEFVVKTDHAFKIWVNDLEEPLIDAWVKSGDDTEFRASRYLVGGRAYALRLEFSAFTQGVKNDKNDREPMKGFIELWWRPPHSVDSLIPERALRSVVSPLRHVPDTTFPPDDASTGFERGTSISRAWTQSITSASLRAADHILKHLPGLTGIRENRKPEENLELARKFTTTFVERAFRRPLSDAEKKLYVDQQLSNSPDLELGVKRIVLLTLASPRFLYVNQGQRKPDAHEIASRLSFALWDSLPDAKLLEAARQDELDTPERVRAQARRMVEDPRARMKFRNFLHHWLEIGARGELTKSDTLYPDFDDHLVADLRTSLLLFVEDIIWGDRSDFRELFQSHHLFVNDRLAAFYGLPRPEAGGFEKIEVEGDRRAGLITQPYLLANLAYHDESSPIHRGVFLLRNVLGNVLHPPPEAFTPLPAELHPDLSTRERIELQTRPDACRGCHDRINPLGFTLERFDAVGRLRSEDRGKAIDDRGSYVLPSGKIQRIQGASQLSGFLTRHAPVRRAFITQLFHHLIHQPILAYGLDTPDELAWRFEQAEFSVRDLLVEIATLAALQGRIEVVQGTHRAPSDPLRAPRNLDVLARTPTMKRETVNASGQGSAPGVFQPRKLLLPEPSDPTPESIES